MATNWNAGPEARKLRRRIQAGVDARMSDRRPATITQLRSAVERRAGSFPGLRSMSIAEVDALNYALAWLTAQGRTKVTLEEALAAMRDNLGEGAPLRSA